MIFCVCVCVEETGRVKNCLGECSLKVTHPDGECSKILVFNPGAIHANMTLSYQSVTSNS